MLPEKDMMSLVVSVFFLCVFIFDFAKKSTRARQTSASEFAQNWGRVRSSELPASSAK